MTFRAGRWGRGLVAAGLVLCGVGAVFLGSSRSSTARVVGANRPVAVGDVRDIRGQNSPTIVRSPRDANRLVVVNRVDTPSFSCAMHVSADGGRTWLESKLPFPAGEEDPPRCFAPDAAFGADGTLYVSFVTLRGLGNEPGAGWVVSSTDGGTTLSEPSRALGPLSFQARLVADPIRPGRLWLSWLQAEALTTLGFADPGNPILVARSEDGGRSWGAPVRVSPPARGRILAPALAVGGEGRLYLAYLDLGEDRLDYHGAHEGRGGEPYQGR
ncbi:MAG: sialidase family protein, partial [Acidimicrobiales bacterium]